MDETQRNHEPFWEANDYYCSGGGPWTFFAYPLQLADLDGLPPDDQACELLANLHARGLRVGPFTNAPVKGTAYLACHKEDIGSVMQAIREMNRLEFCTTRSLELFEEFRGG